jgi:hypothetical protein
MSPILKPPGRLGVDETTHNARLISWRKSNAFQTHSTPGGPVKEPLDSASIRQEASHAGR